MINEVPYEQVLEIRRKAMYPDKDKEFVKLADDERGIHMGYYVDGLPVSVFSLFLKDGELQFRKFATLPEHQNNGYGTKLMEWLLDYAKDMKFARVWCNARVNKTEFYTRFGFVETDEKFEKNGYEYVIMEYRQQ
ncbi:MAG TPA: GNAT family N-acetyltransferase [Dysgonomonas sp.]|nr:GNAT family N-acetyltransferase [Dysgonomonas sp.]